MSQTLPGQNYFKSPVFPVLVTQKTKTKPQTYWLNWTELNRKDENQPELQRPSRAGPPDGSSAFGANWAVKCQVILKLFCSWTRRSHVPQNSNVLLVTQSLRVFHHYRNTPAGFLCQPPREQTHKETQDVCHRSWGRSGRSQRGLTQEV